MSEVADTINEYLSNGGFFNPELMDHVKVRDLLMDARDELVHLEKKNESLIRLFRQLDLDKYPDTYFVSSTLGKFEKGEMPPQITVVPSYGLDIGYVYEKTDKVFSPGW